ncbi:hypothetical protein CGRA01v4_09010 [Colletotrichum graminicola]|nr:hypothetical protein CGRA01v4_09010 [Colletotrichum graminicola]
MGLAGSFPNLVTASACFSPVCVCRLQLAKLYARVLPLQSSSTELVFAAFHLGVMPNGRFR